MRIAQLSHKGMVRPNNEDSIYASTKKDLFIVADGMGGHKGGEIASKIAVDKIKYFIKNKKEKFSNNKDGILKMIIDAINYANIAIFNMSKTDAELIGMGTTLELVYINENDIFIAHVGDSRAYLINNKIKQITKDHSLVQELIDSKTITKQEAQNHPHKNIITRALGTNDIVKVDTYSIKLKENEIILLCTDGLTNMINENEILRIIKSNAPNKAAKHLINLANNNGGFDNISVIIIENVNNI